MGKSNKRKTAKTPKKSNKRGPGRPYTPARKTCEDCNKQYTYGDCKYCKKTNKLSIVNEEPYEGMKLDDEIIEYAEEKNERLPPVSFDVIERGRGKPYFSIQELPEEYKEGSYRKGGKKRRKTKKKRSKK
jgi:hypothetical protein|tara:strand:+ start:3593 stop:3982 length:390 start_codon:yes stop_codon:yes gene_type:complete